MKYINLTKHEIHELTSGLVLKPSSTPILVRTNTKVARMYAGVPIMHTKVSSIRGLPEPLEGTIYIVPALALNCIPKDRTDVVAPGSVKKDASGKVLGCIGFRSKGE